jgi:hypothetical protein
MVQRDGGERTESRKAMISRGLEMQLAPRVCGIPVPVYPRMRTLCRKELNPGIEDEKNKREKQSMTHTSRVEILTSKDIKAFMRSRYPG